VAGSLVRQRSVETASASGCDNNRCEPPGLGCRSKRPIFRWCVEEEARSGAYQPARVIDGEKDGRQIKIQLLRKVNTNPMRQHHGSGADQPIRNASIADATEDHSADIKHSDIGPDAAQGSLHTRYSKPYSRLSQQAVADIGAAVRLGSDGTVV